MCSVSHAGGRTSSLAERPIWRSFSNMFVTPFPIVAGCTGSASLARPHSRQDDGQATQGPLSDARPGSASPAAALATRGSSPGQPGYPPLAWIASLKLVGPGILAVGLGASIYWCSRAEKVPAAREGPAATAAAGAPENPVADPRRAHRDCVRSSATPTTTDRHGSRGAIKRLAAARVTACA